MIAKKSSTQKNKPGTQGQALNGIQEPYVDRCGQ